MKRILIVNQTLMVGGGEKLLYELVLFALSQGYKVDVVIFDNYQREYYDKILYNLGVTVRRIPSDLKKVKKKWHYIKWHLCFRFLLKKRYSSTIIFSLEFASKILSLVKKSNSIHIWHISNLAQYGYNNFVYPYDQNILKNRNINLWLINDYQMVELKKQYGEILCQIHKFKLFINKK